MLINELLVVSNLLVVDISILLFVLSKLCLHLMNLLFIVSISIHTLHSLLLLHLYLLKRYLFFLQLFYSALLYLDLIFHL